MPPEMSQRPLTIVAFGDSITLAGRQPEDRKWTTLLQTRLAEALPARPCAVINAGVGGNTSREGLERIERDVLRHRPDIVTVQFGGNDATQDEQRSVSVCEFRKNLETICARIEGATDARTVLVTFPPIIDDWHGWNQDPFFKTRGGPDGYIDQYRNATRDFARTHNLPLADIDKALRTAIGKHGAKRFILPDGVHLTAQGNEIVAGEVYRVLLRTVKETSS